MFFIVLSLITSYGFSQTTVTDSGPGNYTFLVPCDVTSITIEAWGAGGAGGGGIVDKDGGQGGGGGAYATITTAVTGGQEITYTVGAAGTGSTGDGTAGGNTTVSLGTLNLNGGLGGIQDGITNPPNGGTGSGTGWTISPGNVGADGNSGSKMGGDGADGINYAGSGGIGAGSADGGNATQFGAGGGGAEKAGGTTNIGGNGSDGRVAITYTTAYQFYCTTFYDTLVLPITNVTFAGINNTTTEVTGGSSHEVFCAPTATVTQGTSPTITVEGNTDGNFTDYYTVYADWNQDGTFAAGESIDIGTITNSTGIDGQTASIAFPVPAGATLGLTYMRVMKSDTTYPTDSCSLTYDYGQTEDYLVNVVATVCSTPTVQATTLNLTPTDVTIGGTFTAASPAPDSYLVVMNTTNIAPIITDTTTYTVGQALALGNTVVDIDGDTSFNATGLSTSTTYYFFIFSYNDACTGGPLYYTTTPLTGNTTTLAASYCTPAPTSVDGTGITNVTYGTPSIVNNTTGAEVGNYGDYSAMIGDGLQGATLNVDITFSTAGFTYDTTIWVDWNDDGTFVAGEVVYTGVSLAVNPTTLNASFVIPLASTPGNHRMRIGGQDAGPVSDPCYTGTWGSFEDYTLNVIALAPCVAPIAQATSLVLTPSGTTIFGTFTAAVPASDNYLVVMNTTGATPSPVDTTTYTIGATVGAGNTVVDIDGDTSFNATSLSPSTLYYFFVFSYNSLCSGGPLYYNTSPLNGSATTGVASSYCTPSTTNTATTRYIDDVEFIGTLNDVSNFGTGYTATGYQDYSGLPNAVQQQGEGMNVYVAGGSRGHIKAWIDWNNDGTFDNNVLNGELVYNSGGIGTTSTTFGYIVPIGTIVGTYTLRVRMYNSYKAANPGAGDESYAHEFDSCEVFDTLAGYTEYGEAEDYTFDVITRCDAQITDITNGEACGVLETVDLNVTGAGNVTSFNWYANETGGLPLANTLTGSWTTPAIAATTIYWVAADNGTCEAYERERVIAFLNSPATLTFTPSTPLICGENNPPIQISAASTTQIGYLIDEDFETGLGAFTENNITSNTVAQDNVSEWQPQTSIFEPSENVWFPAVSSGFGTNSFVMTNADTGAALTHNELISATVDASTYINLTLELDMYFSRYNLSVPEYLTIEVSTDGGATWPAITAPGAGPFDPLTMPYAYESAMAAEPNMIAFINDDIGYGTNFEHLSYNLDAYAGQANLKVRIRYYSSWGDGIAVDNFELYGNNTVNPLVSWTNPGGVTIYDDAGATTVYTPGALQNIIYVVPDATALQSSSTWSFTASVTLANGCAATGSVSLQNRTKYFMGATNDWNDPSNWSPVGVPDATNCVIIPDTYSANIAGAVDGDAYNLNVQNGGALDVQPNGTVTVQNFVDVDATGTFTIESEGSLIQVQDQAHVDYVANTGNIDMKRTANIRKLDYVFWSSPVANFPVTSISPGTNTGVIWNWNPTVAQPYAGDFGIWQNTTENMIDGKGYIVRGPDAFTTALQNYTATFNGVPNNGTVNRTINRGTYTGADYVGPTALMVTKDDDNLNLIGNPYPSAIDAQAFMAANIEIEGAVHIWTHGIAPSNAIADPFYQDFVANYSIADYITYNSTGTSTGAGLFSGNIGAGQGFFVTMEDTGATSETVTFDNTMRDRTYRNDDFYRTENSDMTVTNDVTEKHRIWLDLTAPNNQNNRILIGYVTGATEGKDRLYDATNINKTDFRFYSKADDHKLLIQGRPVPFVDTDKVNLEALLPTSGTYTFSINSLDGLFADDNQGIYLEDKELGIIHDLRTSPYTFDANSGVQEDRFVLLYTEENKQLGVEDVITNDELSIFTANSQITAVSNTSNIKGFTMYDVNGRLLINNKNLNSTEYSVNTNNYSTGTYLVTIELKDGRSLTKKVVF